MGLGQEQLWPFREPIATCLPGPLALGVQERKVEKPPGNHRWGLGVTAKAPGPCESWGVGFPGSPFTPTTEQNTQERKAAS